MTTKNAKKCSPLSHRHWCPSRRRSGPFHYNSVIFSLSQDFSYDLSQLNGYIKNALKEGSRQAIVNSGLLVPIRLNLRFSWF